MVGVAVTWLSFTAQRQQALELQAETAQRAATEAAGLIDQLEHELRIAAEVRRLTDLDRDELGSVLSRLPAFGDDFEELALLDGTGRERVRVSPRETFTQADLVDRSQANEFLVPTTNGETYFGPVLYDELTGEPSMTMAVPLVDLRSGLVDGVLVAEVRVKKIWDLIADVRVGESGTAYVVDDRGRVVAHRNPSVVLRGTQYVIPESDGIHAGLTGANVVLASETVRLGSQTLTVVTERPVSEALELTIRTVLITVGLILAALASAGVLGLFAARKIVQPIRNLASTAQAISSGDLSQQATTASQDELGVLSGAFNKMTEQLRDIIGSLEQRVAERTKELSETNRDLETEMVERRRVQEELRETVQRLQALIQASPLPILSVDRR